MLKKILVSIMEWFIEKLFSKEQQRNILEKLTPKQRTLIERIFSLGKKYARMRTNRIKLCLYTLGFIDRAIKELQDIIKDDSKPHLKKAAAWELALWYARQYNKENAQSCLDMLAVALQGEKDTKRLRQGAIIKAECYEILGEVQKAKETLNQAFKLGANADLFLAYANLETSIQNKIERINKALKQYEISGIEFNSSIDAPPYDCLRPRHENNVSTDNNTKVSVIVPVYNAEKVIRTALDSLLSQTWTNLEILVVDDCSDDNTVAIVEEYVQKDNRIQLIKAEKNGGPYIARNLALKVATGEFVTCHDADDWSHHEKIERQAKHLIENPSVIANTSQQARATKDLKFYRRGKPGYIQINMSSLMFRREPVIEKIGYWDCVRFGADGEFVRRIKKVFGEETVVEIKDLLSFQRQSSDSLTGNIVFGYPGYKMGVRKEYEESFNQYHEIAKNLRYEFPQDKRPFAVPEPMWPQRETTKNGRRHFDVIIASEFRLPGGTTMSNAEEIKAQKRMGLRTGLIQMSRYELDPKKSINPKIRELIDGDKVQMLVYGERVTCDVLIIRHPPVLQDKQKYLPDVKAYNVCVIVNQPPKRDYGENGGIMYDIERCSKHLKECFKKEAIWYPIGPLVRETLNEHHEEELKSITLSKEDWVNIIDVSEWKRKKRPKPGEKIRIGRHSRPQYVKWPSDPKELLTIYPDMDNYEIHILGGAEIPKEILGRLPKNWHVLEFGEVHPKEFLEKLDVFVYYTHPDWVESFGRVIIEAMAVGVPVIIPPCYKDLFGEAAIYAEPSEVKEKINKLMNDDEYYELQVKKAHEYVEKHFGYSKHAERINKLAIIKK